MLPARHYLTLTMLSLIGGCLPAPIDLSTAGPILAAVLADGELTCDEHRDRDRYNVCPALRPDIGLDEVGITWREDRILFGLLPNPFHAPYDCYRGRAEWLGQSSYQCCYDGSDLAPDPGSFDYAGPGASLEELWLHTWLDILPAGRCDRKPEGG